MDIGQEITSVKTESDFEDVKGSVFLLYQSMQEKLPVASSLCAVSFWCAVNRGK